MTRSEIYNWLVMAFSEPMNNAAETFYYDKRDREFYSIHLADYLLLNDDLTLNESVNTSYSDNIEQLIANRIYRQDKKDEDIIPVPRLEVAKRKLIMEEFVQNINEEMVLNVLQQRIKNQDGSQRFDFYFGSEASDTIIQEWEELKYLRLIPIINQFIERNEIDLEASRVWDVGGNFSIDLSLK